MRFLEIIWIYFIWSMMVTSLLHDLVLSKIICNSSLTRIHTRKIFVSLTASEIARITHLNVTNAFLIIPNGCTSTSSSNTNCTRFLKQSSSIWWWILVANSVLFYIMMHRCLESYFERVHFKKWTNCNVHSLHFVGTP